MTLAFKVNHDHVHDGTEVVEGLHEADVAAGRWVSLGAEKGGLM